MTYKMLNDPRSPVVEELRRLRPRSSVPALQRLFAIADACAAIGNEGGRVWIRPAWEPVASHGKGMEMKGRHFAGARKEASESSCWRWTTLLELALRVGEHRRVRSFADDGRPVTHHGGITPSGVAASGWDLFVLGSLDREAGESGGSDLALPCPEWPAGCVQGRRLAGHGTWMPERGGPLRSREPAC